MAENVRNSTIDTAADQVRSAADRVASKATDAISSASTSLQNTVSAAADNANAATQWASEKIDAARQAPNDLIAAGAEYIKARPYRSVGIALAAGYVIGRIGRLI
jgi:Uncharacterized conserved protein